MNTAPHIPGIPAGTSRALMDLETSMKKSLRAHGNNPVGGVLALSHGREGCSPATLWSFRVLHVLGLVATLPLVAVERMLLGKRDADGQKLSVFEQADRAVLTALAYAFMV